MGQRQRNHFGGLLRDSVVVMLIDAAQVRRRPEQPGAALPALQVRDRLTKGLCAFLSSASAARPTITKATSNGN